MEYVNAEFNTNFELAEEEPSLGKERAPSGIRNIIEHQEHRNIGFTAKLDRVQYGTYKRERACLQSFTFLFFWMRNTNVHLKSASITIYFERVASIAAYAHQGDGDEEDSIDGGDIPHIICQFPERIYGEPRSETHDSSISVEGSTGGPASPEMLRLHIEPSLSRHVCYLLPQPWRMVSPIPARKGMRTSELPWTVQRQGGRVHRQRWIQWTGKC